MLKPVQDNYFGNQPTLSGGADSINAGLGNDIVRGGSGNDSIAGGIGVDTLYGDEGHDSISGGDGNDSMRAALVMTLTGGWADTILVWKSPSMRRRHQHH